MSAVFPERPIDPPEFTPRDWEDLSHDVKVELLTEAMQDKPRLMDRFYSEALSAGVNPFDYL